MLKQQVRRDAAALKAAKMQRALSETTKNNMETVRRLGCEREAEKERKRGESHATAASPKFMSSMLYIVN